MKLKKNWQDNIHRLIQFIKKKDPRYRLYVIKIEQEKLLKNNMNKNNMKKK